MRDVPKLMDAADTERAGTVGATALAESGMVALPPLALLSTTRLPVKEPAVEESNAIDNTTCCPGDRVAGHPLTPEGY